MRKVLAGGSNSSVTGSTNLFSDQSTITLDNSEGSVDACWEVCIDVCDAWIDCPSNGNSSVSIPPITMTIPADGGQVSHSHGTVTVTDAPKAPARMTLAIGDNYRCTIGAADRDYWAGGGRYCTEILAPAGSIVDVPISVDMEVLNTVSGGFPTSTGTLTATWWPVACATNC